MCGMAALSLSGVATAARRQLLIGPAVSGAQNVSQYDALNSEFQKYLGAAKRNHARREDPCLPAWHQGTARRVVALCGYGSIKPTKARP